MIDHEEHGTRARNALGILDSARWVVEAHERFEEGGDH